MERWNLKNLKEVWRKEQYQINNANRFVASEDVDDNADINRTWETINENLKISAKDSQSYYETDEAETTDWRTMFKLLDYRKQAKLQCLQDSS